LPFTLDGLGHPQYFFQVYATAEVTISEDDITICDDAYTVNDGLWELITSKTPNDSIYTSNNLEKYTQILRSTNAMISPKTGKVKASSSEKYKKIIKPIYDVIKPDA
jgi:hypothetical protein